MEPQVTLLIPNRNEPMLSRTIDDLEGVLGDLPMEIRVEDDAFSTGVGATLRRGLQRVDTEWVIFVMADGSEDPLCLHQMITVALSGVYDAVWGDRWGAYGDVTGYPFLKRLINRAGNHLIAWIHGSHYTDWTDLSKCYRTALVRQLYWADDFRCAVQISTQYWAMCRHLGGTFRYAVVPMRWIERSLGRSAFRTFYHSFGYLKEVVRGL